MSNVSVGRQYEMRVAAAVGGRRCPKHSYGDSTQDLESDTIVGECKLRESLGLETWMQQAEKYAKHGKLTVLFCKKKKLHVDKTIVCVRLPDFLDLMKGAGLMPICEKMEEGECVDTERVECEEGCCLYCEIKDLCKQKCATAGGKKRKKKGGGKRGRP